MTTLTSSQHALPISMEFFPPKTPEGVDKLAAVRQQLYPLKPTYCSVTYGAGGSTQDGTLQTVCAILREGFDAAPHFSCIGASKDGAATHLVLDSHGEGEKDDNGAPIPVGVRLRPYRQGEWYHKSASHAIRLIAD